MRIAITCLGKIPIPPPGTPVPGYGGLERFIQCLRENYLAQGHEVKLFEAMRFPHGKFLMLNMMRAINEWHPDIVQSDETHCNSTLGLLSHSQPIVATVHNTFFDELFRTGGYITYRNAADNIFGYLLVDRVVVHTPRLQRVLRRYGIFRTQCIPYSVDTSLFAPQPTGDPKVAIGLGLVTPRKAWERAAAATEGTGVTFRIIGPIPADQQAYADSLRAQGVELLGELSNARLREEVRKAGFFLHPATSEAGTATAVIEALSMRRVVVAASIHEGVKGLWTADTIEGMRQAIWRLSREPDLLDSLNERARQIAVTEYSAPVMASRYLTLFSQLVARRKP